jgi:hypothetical protein
MALKRAVQGKNSIQSQKEPFGRGVPKGGRGETGGRAYGEYVVPLLLTGGIENIQQTFR